MKNAFSALLFGIIGMGVVGTGTGCIDNSPPPPRVPVPTNDRGATITRRDDGIKPIAPGQQYQSTPPFADEPLISQQLPEQPAFVDAYRKVGSPRIVVLVNRSLATNPGEQDETNALNIDFQAMESGLADWLACGGQVTIISPTMVRQRLTEQQYTDLQQGRPQVQAEIVNQLGADILVQVQARPNRQAVQGMEVRLLGEALNVKGGESLARAFVDAPSRLTNPQMNEYTRLVARKMMDGMLGAWGAPPPAAPAVPATRPQLP